MELTDSANALFGNTAQTLKGSARRLFMARTAQALGSGGQRRAKREFGWNRLTSHSSGKSLSPRQRRNEREGSST